MRKPQSSTHAFEEAARTAPRDVYVLRLYVAGVTPNSTRAVETVRALCEELLAGRYELEVIDVYQQPALARDDQILGVPTLVKRSPEPARKILGDLTNRQNLIAALSLIVPAVE